MNRVILIVLDSVGCGDAPDAALYGDEGSDTLSNLSYAVGGIELPYMGKLGLGNTTDIAGVPPVSQTPGAFGRLTEMSAGKDTTTGHWELCGIILDHPFPTYPNGFPSDLMLEFETRIGRETLGNYPASGTEIIKVLGQEHLRTGKPIIYTSADSVFQIAAHEELIPIPQLYEYCQIARELLVGDHAVGRVIARPFLGNKPENFTRTERRKDFSLEPIGETILDTIKQSNLQVMGVGKIEDIFAHRGLTKSIHSGNNHAGVDAILEFMQMNLPGLIFANLVDFDSLFGHRNDARGYADALEAFDKRLPEIINSLSNEDILIITADHGNDPTTISTDHSRERVPILVYGDLVKPNTDIGTRDSFTDLAVTIMDMLNVGWRGPGNSFLNTLTTQQEISTSPFYNNPS